MAARAIEHPPSRVLGKPERDFRYLARRARGLSPRHEARLVTAARRNPRTREGNLLVLENAYLQLILFIGKEYEAQGLSLHQAMRIGQQAVRRAVLDWDRETEFSEYAVERVQEAFERFLVQPGRERHAVSC